MFQSFDILHCCCFTITPTYSFQGNSVTVFDVYPEAMSKLQDAGAAIGHNPAEVAEKSDTIITMLPNSSHVQEAYAGENGVFQ